MIEQEEDLVYQESQSLPQSQVKLEKPLQQSKTLQNPQYIYHLTNKQKRWTQQELDKLMKIKEQFPESWRQMASEHFSRTKTAVYGAYSKVIEFQYPKQRKKRDFFSQQQLYLLNTIYKKYPQNWKKILEFFPNSKQTQLKYRYHSMHDICGLSSDTVWTLQEDEQLMRLINQLSFEWKEISKRFIKFTANDCYSRYKIITSYQYSDKIQIQSFKYDYELMIAYQKHIDNWEQIAKQLNNKHSTISYRMIFNRYCKHYASMSQWTQQEFMKLKQIHANEKGNWENIANKMKKFNLKECYFKFYNESRLNKQFETLKENLKSNAVNKITNFQKNTKKVGRWTIQQDNFLLRSTLKHGGQWNLVSNSFKNKRNAQSCRLRYLKLQEIYPRKCNKVWTRTEDMLLLKSFSETPYRWQHIYKQFENFTKEQCYRRYSQLIHQKIDEENEVIINFRRNEGNNQNIKINEHQIKIQYKTNDKQQQYNFDVIFKNIMQNIFQELQQLLKIYNI